MNNEELKALVILLESTLGSMSNDDADKVVRGVVALLKSKITEPQQGGNFGYA